jgi:hypothetical protein
MTITADDLDWFRDRPHRCFRMREATPQELAKMKEELPAGDLAMLFDLGIYALVKRDPQTGALDTKFVCWCAPEGSWSDELCGEIWLKFSSPDSRAALDGLS